MKFSRIFGRGLIGLGAAICALPAHAIVAATGDGAAYSSAIVMVLAQKNGGAGFCSGVVLGPRIILTAGHCVADARATRVHFRNAQGAPIMLLVSRIARHPLYRSDAVAARARSVDLALVEIDEPLPSTFSTVSIRPAPEIVGAELTIAGFGVAQEKDPATSGVLRSAHLTIRAPLSELLLWLNNDSNSGACTGDSGGPVFDGPALVGIIAFAEGAGGRSCGKLTQAIRLAPYRAWIEQTIATWR